MDPKEGVAVPLVCEKCTMPCVLQYHSTIMAHVAILIDSLRISICNEGDRRLDRDCDVLGKRCMIVPRGYTLHRNLRMLKKSVELVTSDLTTVGRIRYIRESGYRLLLIYYQELLYECSIQTRFKRKFAYQVKVGSAKFTYLVTLTSL